MPGGAALRFALSGAIACICLQAQWMTGFYEATNGVEPVSAIPWGSYTHVVYFAATTDGLGNVVPKWGLHRSLRSS